MDFTKFVSDKGKPLPVFLLLDCSGSMHGEKIDVLNNAVKEMINDFKGERLSEVDLKLCVITFGGDAKIHTDLSSINKIEFADLIANGMTPMGQALDLCSNIINDKEKVPSKGYKPVVVLVSDGMPNDSWESPLKEFNTGKRTSKCEKWALAIGQDADKNMLQEFLNNPEKKVHDASAAKEISKFFKFVTMSTVARSKSVDRNQEIKIDVLEKEFENDSPDYDFHL